LLCRPLGFLRRSCHEPRHSVLFLPVVIIFASAGLATLPQKYFRIVGAVLLCFSLFFGIKRGMDYKKSTPPYTAIAMTMQAIQNQDDENLVLAGPSRRLLQSLAPELHIREISSVDELKKPGNRRALQDRTIWMVSDVKGMERLKDSIQECRPFDGNPYLYGSGTSLSLNKIKLSGQPITPSFRP